MKHVWTSVVMGALVVMGLAAQADAAPAGRARRGAVAREHRELRRDRRELRQDQRELRRDRRQGAGLGELRRDRRELRDDHRELRQDRRDLRRLGRDPQRLR